MFSESISNDCNKIRFAIQNLIEMYCQAFSVDFEVKTPASSDRKYFNLDPQRAKSNMYFFSN